MAASGPKQHTRRTRFAAVAFALGAVTTSWFALHDEAPATSTRAAASLRAPIAQQLVAPTIATAPAPAPTPKKTAEEKAPPAPKPTIQRPPVQPVKTAKPVAPPPDPEDLLEDRD